ncbi:unnamed protein product [Amoebophrya sp. A25]|nr:unnamed protein product [Amoebophrya sp. A25]|eukprot:GSA25T00008972001.1
MEGLIADVDLRFVFVGGKGGVGKTTSSASLATCFSQRSDYNRVLLISTDPAHSLGDAFQRQFPKGNPTKVSDTLDVLEVDPESSLEEEIAEWTKLMQDSGMADAAGQMGEFQDWLRQIPGIDEATAISNVISFIEEDRYDVVVFDTAPTGHTLKLLQLPKILSQGMEKLQSWSSTLWTYWEVLQGSGSTAVDCRHGMETRLTDYKSSMDKVSRMLKDEHRTQFVTVCIAEYLSVMETKRLMEELAEQGVRSGFVICNQLLPVLGYDPSARGEESRALSLINARNQIQKKYLAMLEQIPMVKHVVKVELQDREITGLQGLAVFASMLMRGPASELQTFTRFADDPYGGRKNLYPELDATEKIFPIGLTVEVFGLGKTPQYNGASGVIRSYDETTQRYGVFVEHLPTQMGIRKLLALKPANIRSYHGSAASRGTGSTSGSGGQKKQHQLLEDAAVKEYLKDPKIWNAYMDVKKDPARIRNYLEDPDVAGILTDMSKKIQNYQKMCGA